MKKTLYVILLAAMCAALLFTCDTGGGKPSTETYTGKDTENKTYTLKITDKSTYDLTYEGQSLGTGTANQMNDMWILTPYFEGASPFIVTVDGNKIISFDGAITTDSGELFTPTDIMQAEPVAGVWEWALSDDSQPNTHITPQTVFAPGGASRIENAVDDPEETDRYDQPVKRPFIKEGVLDKDGNVIDVPVFNFTGVTKVTSPGRGANEGARFPLVGWEATPDEATLELLKTAYAYSFWIRLNSSTASNWAFLTAVVTDFDEEKGYEYKHYFGNQRGDSRARNYTSGLTLDTWHKIIVVIDRSDSSFNMDQDGWLYNYPPTPDPKGLFNQNNAQKIQWQIPLQHQVGAGVSDRGADPYDIIRGEYAFDVDFYGLELYMD